MCPDWMSDRIRPYGPSIFSTISRLAVEREAVNFGQGFPDFDGPEAVKKAAARFIAEGHNQYAPLAGVGRLRHGLKAKYRSAAGLEYDAETEISVYCGATEAMYAALTTTTNPGDEWIVFEPTYDTYVPIIEMCGARAVPVPLVPPDFAFSSKALVAAFSSRTRGVIVNTPHNPTGRVFSQLEMDVIAELCVRHDCLAVTDEVYEHLVFPGPHIHLAALPGMRERTITISSTAKTFSMTGWKIGYALAPPQATEGMRRMHQFITFAVATPFQMAMAEGIENLSELVKPLHRDLVEKRRFMCRALNEIGFRVFRPEGTFFILADFSRFSDRDDVAFSRWLIESDARVAVIPISVFYQDPELAPRQYVRFCFAKTWDTIHRGLEQLKSLPARETA